MVKRSSRNISRSTVKGMMQLSHFKFRQFLIHKSKELGSKLIICDESYTSKTCGRCGLLHNALGSSKTFACPSCGYTVDRDVNGARNVLLRYCAKHKVTLPNRGGGCYDASSAGGAASSLLMVLSGLNS
jgi:putative transposase